MKILEFLKNKILSLLINFGMLFFIGIFLFVFEINWYGILFFQIIYLFSFTIPLLIEYIQRNNYYNHVIKTLDNLDKKYLLSELIEDPSFLEGRILYHCLQITNKSMNDEIAKYRISSKEYREYIELWIHEVKTPIASSKLIIENNPSDITNSLSEELDIVDYYLEQALFYSRSNGVEKDYIIKEIQLKDIVNCVIRKNSKDFIQNKIKITIENIEQSVNTDTKWLEFILNQVIVNAIKYRGVKPNHCIQVFAEENPNHISLFIKDNGIGISEKDLPNVFEKGYTGESGRQYAKSTGIGLYLCKKLCDKLGLAIYIQSIENSGTTVELVFPKTKFMNVI